jgi:1-phosphofructokinase
MSQTVRIATVTLNPAIDQTVSVPDFKAGAVNRVQQTQSDPGGKGVNVAWFLSDYGFPVTVTGFLGEENTIIFERLFARKKIEDRFVRIAGSTRTGIKIIDAVNQETTDLNFPGQAPTPENVQTLFQVVSELTESCDWFVLAGSIPTDVSAEIYGELVQLIRRKGRNVALDTSGSSLDQALSAAPTLVKPNIHELEELEGRSLNTQARVIQAARNWLEKGLQTVIVSMGAEGAIFVEVDEVVLAQPPRVTVKSTVGAGDAMVSGTVAGKTQGYSLAECARLATAFSTSAISQVGAGLPAMEAIEHLKGQVKIKQLSY